MGKGLKLEPNWPPAMFAKVGIFKFHDRIDYKQNQNVSDYHHEGPVDFGASIDIVGFYETP
jgi:hypothetical protein